MQANHVVLPHWSSNRVEIEEDGKTIVYTLDVTNIRSERNGNVIGRPCLEKCILTPCPDHKEFNWRRLRFENRPSYPSSYQVHIVWVSTGVIFKNGVVCHDETSIRHNLREELLKKHILLSREFLNCLLLPIEKRLLESLELGLAN